MNEQLTTDPVTKEGDNSVAVKVSPGLLLRKAREKANISQQDVARRLHLTNWIVESLENDDYSKMAGLTFVKGYLRSYANLVNLSPDEIITAFNTLGHAEDSLSNVRISVYKTQASVQEKHVRWITYVIALGLLSLVLVWWNTENSKPNSNLVANSAAGVTTAAAPATVNPPANADKMLATDQTTAAADVNSVELAKPPAPTPATIATDSKEPKLDPSNQPSATPNPASKPAVNLAKNEATTEAGTTAEAEINPPPAKTKSDVDLAPPFEDE